MHRSRAEREGAEDCFKQVEFGGWVKEANSVRIAIGTNSRVQMALNFVLRYLWCKYLTDEGWDCDMCPVGGLLEKGEKVEDLSRANNLGSDCQGCFHICCMAYSAI